MKKQYLGIFQITQWDEDTLTAESNIHKRTFAQITQQYQGDIIGDSSLQYLMNYQDESQATFVGYETIRCTINDKEGCFVLCHSGTFEKGIASSTFVVVDNSGTGDFSAITGAGTFTSTEHGQAKYCFDLDI